HETAVLHAEPQDAVLVEQRRVRILRLWTGHVVVFELAGLDVELADVATPVASVPDVAILVVDQPVRSAPHRDRVFLHLSSLRIEPAKPVGKLTSPPDRAIGSRQRIMRTRAGR